MKKLEGKTALVTGASKGLGRAMAAALAAEGAVVGIVARNREQLATAAREIGATPFTADVSREDEVERLEKDVGAALGDVQILINNAGINIRKRVTEFSLAEWNQVMDTNVTSVFLMCRAFVPHMQGKGYGRILNLTSTMSHVSLPGRAAYSASKTALLGVTRALALELAPDAITVNGISPGPFGTEMNTALMQNPELNAQFMSAVPLSRWGRVEEVGALAVYLCSEEAGFITGTDILIDGGWCAR
jgi:NAD(P)-dependent dehydrogenase (short-subunit alcohol dehydrogenase family)